MVNMAVSSIIALIILPEYCTRNRIVDPYAISVVTGSERWLKSRVLRLNLTT
jgi:hypothetical protein